MGRAYSPRYISTCVKSSSAPLTTIVKSIVAASVCKPMPPSPHGVPDCGRVHRPTLQLFTCEKIR